MSKIHVKDLLENYTDINVAAPMVRYSKLPFRELVAQYNTHITYTPMMLAREFSQSDRGRDSDFSTNSHERGIHCVRRRSSTSCDTVQGCLIAQFGASHPVHFADAAEIISPFVDGVDLNCGCPQRWAIHEGIGSGLLRNPENVRDLIRAVKARIGWSFPVLTKIRVDPDVRRTEQLVSTAIAAGSDVLTVHGRYRTDSSDGTPVRLDKLAEAASFAKGQVPVVGNGDIFSVADAANMRASCNINAVMSARGLLMNPALFSGLQTSPEVVSKFMSICMRDSLLFPLFHRHVAMMCERMFPTRAERIFFNTLSSYPAVLDYCEEMGLSAVNPHTPLGV